MRRERGLEVLAPAGNLEILKSVIHAGADAVYFGGDLFGARAYAANFSIEDAAEGIRYAHLYGAKAYLTVNTLLKNLEVERKLRDYLRQYEGIGIDAVIVQDMAVLDMLRTDFPSIAIHASTQMSICGEGAQMLQQMGVSRVVTARELSLSEIAQIYDATGMEIETFVHGALCYCYSGQCLFSSLAGGRSGNRGRCAQPCRQPYEVYQDGKHIHTPGPYVLSPKDLCGIQDIKALYDAGVYSLKIEGRMKQREYAAGVVSLYRKYVDRFLEDPAHAPVVSDADYEQLLNLGNRCGFTDDYYTKPNSRQMITFVDPAHRKGQGTEPIPDRKIPLTGTLIAHIGQPLNFTLQSAADQVTVTGQPVQAAIKQPTSSEEAAEKLQAFGGTPFTMTDLVIEMDPDAFLPARELKELRRQATQQLEDAILTSYNKEETPACLDADVRIFRDQKEIMPSDPDRHIFATCCTREQLAELIKWDLIDTVCIEAGTASELTTAEIDAVKQSGKKCYLRLPDVMRHLTPALRTFLEQADRTYDGLLVPSYDGLAFAAKHLPAMQVVCDHRIYTYSNASLEALQKLGLRRFTAPVELNLGELRHRDNRESLMILYGYLPVMITAGCMNQSTSGCTHRSTTYRLTDQKGHTFSYRNDCNTCTSTLYNSAALCLFEEMEHVTACHFAGYRMDFTVESGKTVGQILAVYGNMIEGKSTGASYRIPGNLTKGHLYRGVE